MLYPLQQKNFHGESVCFIKSFTCLNILLCCKFVWLGFRFCKVIDTFFKIVIYTLLL